MMQNKIIKSSLVIVFSLLSTNAFAGQSACDLPDWPELEKSDIVRMERLEISRTKGLGAAMRSTNKSDRKLVAMMFENDFVPISDMYQVEGNYNCRTIKLGGLTDLTIYGWFKCQIRAEAKVLTINKTTGSQNFFGVMVQAGNGLSYSGASNYGYEKIYKLYGQDETRNQVGCLSAIDKSMDRFVLELPEPKLESVHDIIMLERIK